MRLVRKGSRPRLQITRSEWRRIGIKAGWSAPGIRHSSTGYICTECGALVGGHDLKRHLVDMHYPGAKDMDFDEVRQYYFKKPSGSGLATTAQSVAGKVEIRRYGDSAWAPLSPCAHSVA